MRSSTVALAVTVVALILIEGTGSFAAMTTFRPGTRPQQKYDQWFWDDMSEPEPWTRTHTLTLATITLTIVGGVATTLLTSASRRKKVTVMCLLALTYEGICVAVFPIYRYETMRSLLWFLPDAKKSLSQADKERMKALRAAAASATPHDPFQGGDTCAFLVNDTKAKLECEQKIGGDWVDFTVTPSQRLLLRWPPGDQQKCVVCVQSDDRREIEKTAEGGDSIWPIKITRFRTPAEIAADYSEALPVYHLRVNERGAVSLMEPDGAVPP